MGVGGDLGVDFQGEGEGVAAGFGGDTGGRAHGDGPEEVFEFEAEGFGAGWVEFFEAEAGGWMLRG